MKTRTIEVIVSPTGDINIDAVGFKGADCEQATKFLEEALGTVQQKQRKTEFLQRHKTKLQQKVGR
jgi:hypothetical protein